MASKQIAAQMYTIRQSCRTPADIAESCKKLAAIGYGAVQASGLGEIAPTELRKILDDNGLFCCATHINTDQLIDDLPGLIDELKTLACPYTAVGSMGGEWRTPQKIREFCAILESAGAAMKAEGIGLGYHNHSFEFARHDGKLLMDWLFDLTTRENVFPEIDTYWVQHGGGSPAAWIRKLGPIPVIHLKDMGVIDDKQVMLEIGEGNLDWPAILSACKIAGVKYYAIEQDECNGRDPFESLAISLRNCQAMGLT